MGVPCSNSPPTRQPQGWGGGSGCWEGADRGGSNGPFPLWGERGDFQPKHPGAQRPHTFPASLPSFIPEDIGNQTHVGLISCSCSEVIELCL